MRNYSEKLEAFRRPSAKNARGNSTYCGEDYVF
jgi:hypothetical protein